MIDELNALGGEYDALLAKLNDNSLTLDDAARMQAIEDRIASQFGYDWMRQHLCDEVAP